MHQKPPKSVKIEQRTQNNVKRRKFYKKVVKFCENRANFKKLRKNGAKF